VKLLSYIEDVARMKYKTGEGSYSAVMKAQVELGKLEDRLRSLHDLREPLMAGLNATLNRPAATHVPWPGALEEEAPAFTDEQLSAWLAEGNPELRAIDFTTAKERIAADLAKREYFPDITLGIAVIDTDDASTPGVPESGKDPVVSMLSIDLPIWYGRHRAARREAGERYAAAQQERRDMENRLVTDLKVALYEFRDAGRKIDLYRDTLVIKARQSLEVSQQAFAAGMADFLDLIEAQRTLLEFELAYERALTDRAERLAEIEMLIGREIPRSVSECVAPGNRFMKGESS